MKIFLKLFFALSLLTVQAYGQGKEFKKAFLIDSTSLKGSSFKYMFDEVYTKYFKNTTYSDVNQYQWNKESHQVSFLSSNKTPEAPIDHAVFVMPNLSVNLQPNVQTITDTVKKTKTYQIKIDCDFDILTKTIDAATSKVVSYNTTRYFSLHTTEVIEPVKVFGQNHEALYKKSPSKYNELLEAKVVEICKKKFNDCIFSTGCNKATIRLLNTDIPVFEVLSQPGFAEKKAKQIKVKADNFYDRNTNTMYSLFTKRDFEGYPRYEPLTNGVFIKEVGSAEIMLSTIMFGSKELAESLNANEKILMVETSTEQLALNKLSAQPNHPYINVSLKKKCLFCDIENEMKLVNNPVLRLVERSCPELKYFANLAKNEKFLDYSIEDLQGKQLGYELLINENLEIIDVKTNRVVPRKDRGYKTLGIQLVDKLDNEDIISFLSNYDQDKYGYKIIKPTEIGKNKIDKMLLFSPAGFSKYTEIMLCEGTEEDVDGEKIMRYKKIGKGYTGKIHTPFITEFKIKDGEKAIFESYTKDPKKLFAFVNYEP